MNRRDFFKAIGVGAAIGSLIVACSGSQKEVEQLEKTINGVVENRRHHLVLSGKMPKDTYKVTIRYDGNILDLDNYELYKKVQVGSKVKLKVKEHAWVSKSDTGEILERKVYHYAVIESEIY